MCVLYMKSFKSHKLLQTTFHVQVHESSSSSRLVRPVLHNLFLFIYSLVTILYLYISLKVVVVHPFKWFAMESDYINATAHKMSIQVHCTINTSCLSVTTAIRTVQHSMSGCVGLTAMNACTSQVIAPV